MRQLLTTVLVILLASAGLSAQEPLSRIFKLEGHGLANHYYWPDDEVRRITAVPGAVTPHIEWLSPADIAPVRVLAIAHQMAGRWPLELAERFNIDLVTVYCHDSTYFGAPMTEHRGAGQFVQHTADVESSGDFGTLFRDFENVAVFDNGHALRRNSRANG